MKVSEDMGDQCFVGRSGMEEFWGLVPEGVN